MHEVLFVVLALAALGALVVLIVLTLKLTSRAAATGDLARVLEEKHRAMLTDLHGGLAQQSERVTSRLSEELGQ
ncbi:MAG TPA: hypothetical protein VFU53_07330, partial [Burkholderiales bacterium]|nr:hypothetical protein [Burkholderiales bacterium]